LKSIEIPFGIENVDTRSGISNFKYQENSKVNKSEFNARILRLVRGTRRLSPKFYEFLKEFNYVSCIFPTYKRSAEIHFIRQNSKFVA